MRKFIMPFKDLLFKITVTENNTNIEDSYRIKSISDMQQVLYMIQDECEPSLAINKRGIWDMTNEWRVHNLLYALGIEKDRTRSVDLDINQPWYMTVAYSLLSPFYFHFL